MIRSSTIHAIDCSTKLTKYYQVIKSDKQSTVTTYERGINLVKKYLMKIIISIIEDHLINYFKKNSDLKTTIIIYKTLCVTLFNMK